MPGRQSNALGTTDLVFANNIIQGGGRAVSLTGPLLNATWQGNILWSNADGPGDIPATGYTAVDPKLKQADNGEYRLQPDSPAIGKAVGSYAYVTVDVNGQTCGDKLDVGADQFKDGPITHRILTPADVGPHAH